MVIFEELWMGSGVCAFGATPLCAPPAQAATDGIVPAPAFRKGTMHMALRKKELDYLKSEMTWREFADAAGATVLIRGLIRGSSKKISTTTKKKVQQSIALTMADAGRNAMVKDALREIRKALAKNGPPIVDRLTAKDVKKAKVSKRLQKQVEATIANRHARPD
jgi:hypothetical protein